MDCKKVESCGGGGTGGEATWNVATGSDWGDGKLLLCGVEREITLENRDPKEITPLVVQWLCTIYVSCDS